MVLQLVGGPPSTTTSIPLPLLVASSRVIEEPDSSLPCLVLPFFPVFLVLIVVFLTVASPRLSEGDLDLDVDVDVDLDLDLDFDDLDFDDFDFGCMDSATPYSLTQGKACCRVIRLAYGNSHDLDG